MRPDKQAYIQSHYRTLTDRQLAKNLGIPKHEVREFMKQKGLERSGQPVMAAAATAPRAIVQAAPARWWWLALAWAGLAVLGALLYRAALHNNFVWDDDFLIVNNPFIQSLGHAKDFFTHNLGYAGGDRSNYYRPLQELTYALDYRFWKLEPAGYHAFNIGLHVLNAGLVLLILFRLSGRMFMPSLLAAVFFLAQPLHSQAVAYVAARADLLMSFFMLLGFYFYLLSEKRPIAGNALCYASFLLALLSKELSVLFPLLIVLHELAHGKKVSWKRIAGFLVVIAGWWALRHYALLQTAAVTQEGNSGAPPFAVRLPLSFKLLTFYIGNLFWPAQLHMERQVVLPNGWLDPTVLAAAGVYGAFAWAWATRKDRDPAAIFLASWFMLFWFPVSNLFALKKVAADHWMYMPSIGFYGLLFYLFFRVGGRWLPSWKALAAIAALASAPFLVYFSRYTAERAHVWRHKIPLYEDILQYDPDNIKALLNLGNAYLEKDDVDTAKTYYERILAKHPVAPNVYSNLGYIELENRNYEAAEKALKTAIAQDPLAVSARVKLALTYEGMQRFDDAIAALDEALKLAPDSFMASYHAGRIEDLKGDEKKASEYLEKAVKIAPDDEPTKALLGEVYEKLGDKEKAKFYSSQVRGDVLPAGSYGQSTSTVKKKFNEWGEEVDS